MDLVQSNGDLFIDNDNKFDTKSVLPTPNSGLFFNANLNIPESKVIDLIGNYANDLVKMFCIQNRHYNIMSNHFKLETQKDLDLTYIHYANIIEQSYRMNIGDCSYFASVKNKIVSLEKQL